MTVFVEDWGATYGAPYMVLPDDSGSSAAELVEDGAQLRAHDVPTIADIDQPIAFVDGVRRGEAALWQEDAGGILRVAFQARTHAALLLLSGRPQDSVPRAFGA